MKSVHKGYKEARKERKDPLRIARHTIAGIGGILHGLPFKPKNEYIYKYLYRPLTLAYMVNQGLQIFKMFPDNVRAGMPELAVVRDDLLKQTALYRDARDKYNGATLEVVDRGNLEGKLTM